MEWTRYARLPNYAVYLINAEQAVLSQGDGVLMLLGLQNPKARVVNIFNLVLARHSRIPVWYNSHKSAKEFWRFVYLFKYLYHRILPIVGRIDV
jgi:hypothetical protein